MKPRGLMYSNVKTAIAVTSSSITNIITHTDALKGSAAKEERETGRSGKKSQSATIIQAFCLMCDYRQAEEIKEL